MVASWFLLLPELRVHNFWGTIPLHTVFAITSEYVGTEMKPFDSQKALPGTSSNQGATMSS